MAVHATVRFGAEAEPPPEGGAFAATVSGRKILDGDGNVWLGKIMSSWGMSQNLSNAEITTALEAVEGLGFNAVLVAPFGVNWGGWAKYTNVAGAPFFATTAGGSTSTTPFVGQLGAAWSTFDWIVSESERLGITVIVSLYLSLVIADSGVDDELAAVSNAQAETFGIRLATRYLSAPNLMWHLEVDSSMNVGDTVARRVDYVFKGITATETTPRLIVVEPQCCGLSSGYQQFIAHNGTDPTGYQWFRLSTNALYNGDLNSVENIDGIYTESGATSYPVWDCEPTYVSASGGVPWTRQSGRCRNYSVFIRGYFGINHGDEDWWPFGESGIYTGGFEWFEVPAQVGSLDAQRCWTLVDTYCADTTWAPNNSFIVTGLSSGSAKAAGGASNTAALAYFPTNRSVAVDTTVIAGTANVRLRWYDPALGSFSTISASEAQSSSRSVTMPSAHADSSADYVLVVDLA